MIGPIRHDRIQIEGLKIQIGRLTVMGDAIADKQRILTDLTITLRKLINNESVDKDSLDQLIKEGKDFCRRYD